MQTEAKNNCGTCICNVVVTLSHPWAMAIFNSNCGWSYEVDNGHISVVQINVVVYFTNSVCVTNMLFNFLLTNCELMDSGHIDGINRYC